MYWSNTWSGVVPMVLALATLATLRRALAGISETRLFTPRLAWFGC